MKNLVLLAATAVLLAGCASSSSLSSSPRGDCLDARKNVRDFERVGLREVRVTLEPKRSYRVLLAHDCPQLERAETISFANSFPRMVGYRSDVGPVWANALEGSSQVCGGPSDRLMIRERFYEFNRPMDSCAVARVERER